MPVLLRCAPAPAPPATPNKVDERYKLHQNKIDEFKKVHKMTLPPPASFESELTTDRLESVSQWLLEEFYATEDDLSRQTDNGYTRGCTTFGRQRSRIIAEALSARHPWLGLLNNSNDIVFTIGGVPCRFSNDDPSNPSKNAVMTANRFQMEFLEFAAEGEPARFCFVIDRGIDSAAEPRVEFVGFTPSGDVACRWVSNSVRVLRLEGRETLPQSVEVAKPLVAPKRLDEGDAAAKEVG
jgi:hypothetical protein